MIYKMKLCKIKRHFSIFTSDRGLTGGNTELTFPGFRETFSSPFFQHLSSHSELLSMLFWGMNTSAMACKELLFPRLAPQPCAELQWGCMGFEEAQLLLPLGSLFLEHCFSRVTYSWWRIRVFQKCLWITEEANCMPENMVGIRVANLLWFMCIVLCF